MKGDANALSNTTANDTRQHEDEEDNITGARGSQSTADLSA